MQQMLIQDLQCRVLGGYPAPVRKGAAGCAAKGCREGAAQEECLAGIASGPGMERANLPRRGGFVGLCSGWSDLRFALGRGPLDHRNEMERPAVL